MKVTYVIAHKNRANLLTPNLQTLLCQTDKDFEIVIVDNSDTAGLTDLRSVTSHFRGLGLDIRCFHIDPSAHPMSHKASEYGGNFNPALAQNIGVKKAKGEIICLTSPEVINAATNVERAKLIFSDGKSHFALGWIDEAHLAKVGPKNLPSGISSDVMKQICTPAGNGAMCRSDVPRRPWLPINYFLGFLRREDFIKIGGIDERFMESIGWEDNFFAHCCEQAGMPAELHEQIAGIHLWHSRSYQMDPRTNQPVWEKIKATCTANVGFDWGSDAFIRAEF